VTNKAEDNDSSSAKRDRANCQLYKR